MFQPKTITVMDVIFKHYSALKLSDSAIHMATKGIKAKKNYYLKYKSFLATLRS